MLSFPKAPVLLTSAIAAALTLHGLVRAQNPAPMANNAGVAQSPAPVAAPYYGPAGVAPADRFLPPLPVFPLFASPGLPVFAPPSLPQPWFAPLPLLDMTRPPVDEGTLQTQEREITDAQGTRLLIRERSWKTAGIPCRELTVLQPATEAPADRQPAVAPAVEPAPTTPPANAEQSAAPKPVLAPIEAAAVPPQTPADQVADPAPLPTAKTQTAASAPAAVPTIAAPVTEGIRVYRYEQAGGMKGIYSSIQVPPGERNLVGIGVSTDSTNGTRLYRYYQGQPTAETRDPKAQ